MLFRFSIRYLALDVFAFGDGDATGDGLAPGLGLFAGALPVAALGEGEVVGGELAAPGLFELSVGSVAHPTANTDEKIDRSNTTVRATSFSFSELISFGLVPTRFKNETMIARLMISSNGCSHRSFAGIAARPAPKPSFSKACLHD
ncbi:MAG: hypothetical protein LC775_07260 [Acidobacteria bacterium]|nr:hypothetical protein [Acidobacteriota bacterium]